jgi:hypothetical protein
MNKIKNWISNLNSFILGVKKGFNIPMLPNKISIYYNNIFIRILRFIGGVCLLLVLTSAYINLPKYSQNIILIMAIIQSIQIILILIIKLFYAFYTLRCKGKDFEVRNSPLNEFATHIARIIYCAKIGCAVTGGTAATVAAGASFDSVLEAAGRDKIFVPMMGRWIKDIFGEVSSNANTNLNKMVEDSKNINSNTKSACDNLSNSFSKYNSLSDKDKLEFNKLLKKGVEDIINNKE